MRLRSKESGKIVIFAQKSAIFNISNPLIIFFTSNQYKIRSFIFQIMATLIMINKFYNTFPFVRWQSNIFDFLGPQKYYVFTILYIKYWKKHDKDNKCQNKPSHYDLLWFKSIKSGKIVFFAQISAIFDFLGPQKYYLFTIFCIIYFKEHDKFKINLFTVIYCDKGLKKVEK